MVLRLALLALAALAIAWWWARSDVPRSNHVMDVLI